MNTAFNRYKTNLRREGNYIISYSTKVAKIEGDYLVKLDWNVNGKISSRTTTKHINYAASELNLIIK